MTNLELLNGILKLHKHLRKHLSPAHKDNPNFFFDGGSLEVTPDASYGMYHSWDVSYHNGDYYNFQKKQLSTGEIGMRLQTIYDALRNEAFIKAKEDIVNELAEARLKNLGF